MNRRTAIRVGVGAGFADDRLDAGLDLVERADLDYLDFEGLGARTVAMAQRDQLEDPSRGYHPLLVERLRRVLPACQAPGRAPILLVKRPRRGEPAIGTAIGTARLG